MSRKPRIPSYRSHKASGQAVVVLAGKSFYLGKFGSAASHEEYERVVTEWLANHRTLPVQAAPTHVSQASVPLGEPLTIAELVLRYWRFVQSYYVKGGAPTSEQDTIRQALRFVRKLYGLTPAREFGPLSLKAVRQAMIDHPVTRKFKVRDPETGDVRQVEKVVRVGLARRHINKQVGRIKRMFAWAVEQELVAVDVHRALVQVKGLRKDKTTAREKSPVLPVSEDHIQVVLQHVPPVIATMIQVQRLCGGRPQDIVQMTPADIDCSRPVWEYRPGRQKTSTAMASASSTSVRALRHCWRLTWQS